MDLSPYSLNLEKSNDYYKDVEYLTDVILEEFEKINTTLVPSLLLHYSGTDSKPRNFKEYVFEFLMIGTYWRVYGSRAVNPDEKYQKILRNLVCLRNKNGSHKEIIDTIRGSLMTQICGPKKIHRPIWNLTWKTSINC
jgi:hypothetical protein